MKRRIYDNGQGDMMGDKKKRSEQAIQIRNTTNDFLVFSQENGGDGVDVLVADENVWLTQKSMCALYDVVKSTVSEHLSTIFSSGELDENSTVRNFRTVASNGKSYDYKYYNLQGIVTGYLDFADFDRFIKENEIETMGGNAK